MSGPIALESTLVQTLRAALPETVRLTTAAELADIADGHQPTPAVAVIYDGYRVAHQDPAHTLLTTGWLIVAMVRHLGDVRGGSSARAEADGILTACIDAVLTLTEHNVRIATAPGPGYRKGYGYYPLAITADHTIWH